MSLIAGLANHAQSQSCIESSTTVRVSVNSAGVQANGHSFGAAISSDGDVVAFQSLATNLVGQDLNAVSDVFVHDRTTAMTSRVSVGTGGAEANGASTSVGLSADGLRVVFTSMASNLTTGDLNATSDVFVHDRSTGSTHCVSLAPSGITANGPSYGGSISPDGRYVVFTSSATDLVPGDTNGAFDVFLHDTLTGSTECVSVTVAGTPGNGLSYTPDLPRCFVSEGGRYVTFESAATNLTVGDTNGRHDVFVRDRLNAVTTRVSVSSSGVQANDHSTAYGMSHDGGRIAFASSATNLVSGGGFNHRAYVHELSTGATQTAVLTPAGLPVSYLTDVPALDPSGDFLSFIGGADNIVPGDENGVPDAYVVDLRNGQLSLLSVSSTGLAANWFGGSAALATRARAAVFTSDATNLVAGDFNGVGDIFVRDTGTRRPSAYCTAKTNSAGCVPMLEANGVACATAPVRFEIVARNVLNGKAGLLFYGVSGRSNTPFHGGWLCVDAPRRTPLQDSGGNPPPDDCSGAYSFDFGAWIQSGVDPTLTASRTVCAQYYSRDPGFAPPRNIGLSSAVEFDIGSY